MKVRKSTLGENRFVALCVFSAYEGHLKEGFLTLRCAELSETERLECVCDAVSVPAGKEHGAFAADNFLLVESEEGELVAGLTVFSDHSHPKSFESFEHRFTEALRRRHGEEACSFAVEFGKHINCGWEMLRQRAEDAFHVELVFVAKRFRGSAALSLLMESAFEEGRKRGFKSAEIS
jgi:GNAT superfamily N-acetyltransferase